MVERERLERAAGSRYGKQGGQAVVAADPPGGGEGPVDADEVGGHHEELGAVEGEVIGRRRGLGPVHPHQPGASARVDHDPPAGEVAVGDAGPVQAVEVDPGVVERRVVDLVGRDVGQRPARRVADHEQGVVAGPGDADREQVGDHGSAALGQEQDQGLVLDLLAPPEGHSRAGVLVPDGAPELGEQPGVGAVPTDHLDGQPLVGVADEGGVAPRLLRGQAEAVVGHAELAEGAGDLVEGRRPAGRAQGEVGDRRGAPGQDHAGQHRHRQALGQVDRGDGRQPEHDLDHATGGSGEVRPGGEEDGDRRGQGHDREVRAASAEVGAAGLEGLGDVDQAREGGPDAQADGEGEQEGEQEAPAAGHEGTDAPARRRRSRRGGRAPRRARSGRRAGRPRRRTPWPRSSVIDLALTEIAVITTTAVRARPMSLGRLRTAPGATMPKTDEVHRRWMTEVRTGRNPPGSSADAGRPGPCRLPVPPSRRRG